MENSGYLGRGFDHCAASLDLAGGLSVIYQTQHHVSASQLAETEDILNNRVNGLGANEYIL